MAECSRMDVINFWRYKFINLLQKSILKGARNSTLLTPGRKINFFALVRKTYLSVLAHKINFSTLVRKT